VRFLETERTVLEQYLPGFDTMLVGLGVPALEQDLRETLAEFKAAGGPGLLIPRDLGGSGASPMEAVRVQRAIGSRSPSLAVATTMHHFSVATIVEMTDRGLESVLLEGIATAGLLVASGFGEGHPSQGVLSPGMRGVRSGKGVVLSGVKRPCSLGTSMDLLTVSVKIDGRLAVVLVPPSLPGVSRRPFWRSPALLGTDSCEIILTDVEVPNNLVSYSGEEDRLDAAQVGGFVWFETLICGSYIGVASALVELALAKPVEMTPQLVAAIGAIEMAMAATEQVADMLARSDRGEGLLARALAVRYGVQDVLFTAASAAAELLGGVSFATLPEVALLLASSRALVYHPPSKARMAKPFGEWLDGGRLQLD
jgi:alkylation response protein AidB-like acyl-CoA dehydrogenase